MFKISQILSQLLTRCELGFCHNWHLIVAVFISATSNEIKHESAELIVFHD